MRAATRTASATELQTLLILFGGLFAFLGVALPTHTAQVGLSPEILFFT